VTDKLAPKDGNILIFVSDYEGVFKSTHLFIIEAIEHPKSYEVVEVCEYAGEGFAKKLAGYGFALRSYRKSDPRVSLDFEEARKKSLDRLKKSIEDMEAQLKKNKEKLETWMS
jgi:hypothetical protein